MSAPTILCIDDEPTAIQARKELLESEGYVVIGAPSGEAGLLFLRSNKVDAVILDYWMSGMNGLNVAREIKKLRSNVPIIILSGWAELPGEAVGITDRWIMKGHSSQQLLDAVSILTQAPRN